MADVSANHHPPSLSSVGPAAAEGPAAAGRPSPPPQPTDIVAGPGPRSQAFHDSLLPSQATSVEIANAGDVTMQSPVPIDLGALRGDGAPDLPPTDATAVDRDGNPSTEPISAYFKLDFESFSYYIQTLKVVIGRRVVVRPFSILEACIVSSSSGLGLSARRDHPPSSR